MATLTTLRPDGTGTVSSVNTDAGATTDLHLAVDDDPDSPTTTDYIKNAVDTTGDKTTFLLMTATDADFASMSTLQIDAHLAAANFVDDTCTLFARLYQSDESTALTDEVQVATQAQTGLRSVAFTNVTAGDKTVWDGARLRLRWAYTRSMGADGGQQRVTAVELDGTYAAAVANVEKSDSDSATLTESISIDLASSDSAALTESAAVAAAVSGADSATVADTTYVLDLAGADSAAFAESNTLGVVLTGTEAAVVAESFTLAADIAGTDAATTTDNDGVVVETFSVDGTDSAAVTDTFDSLTATLTGTDNPTVSEAGTIGAVSSAADSATVSDAGSVASTFVSTDSATATDNGATLSAEVAGVDSGTVTESASVTVETAASDAGAVSDTGSLSAALVSADSATIDELFASITATLTGLDGATISETGTAGEEIAKTASDSFTFSETGSVEETVYVANEKGRSGATPGQSGGQAPLVAASKSRIEVADMGRSGI